MTRYTLSARAQQDLVDIRDYYLEQGSPRAGRRTVVELVEAFRVLGRAPTIGHRRKDLAEERRVLFWSMRDYVIVCRSDKKPIEIVMVVAGPAISAHY